jgi:hypothetical protein
MTPIKRPKAGWKIEGITTHPGEMLLDEFLIPLDISQNQLALDIRVSCDTDRSDCPGQARRQVGNRIAFRTVLRKQSGVLAQPATDVRPQQDAAGLRRTD